MGALTWPTIESSFSAFFHLAYMTRSRVNITSTKSKYTFQELGQMLEIDSGVCRPVMANACITNNFLWIVNENVVLIADCRLLWGRKQRPCVNDYGTLHFVHAAYQLFTRKLFQFSLMEKWMKTCNVNNSTNSPATENRNYSHAFLSFLILELMEEKNHAPINSTHSTLYATESAECRALQLSSR